MNQKITDLIKGRNDGQEILNALDIKESTKFCSKVEKEIKSTIKLIDEGMTLAEATAKSRGEVSSSAIAPQQSTAIASSSTSQEIPEDVIQTIGEVSRQTGEQDGRELPDAIADFTQIAAEQTNLGLKGVVQSNYFQGLLDEIRKPEFNDRVREELKKRRAQNSKAN